MHTCNIHIPADVSKKSINAYHANYQAITRGKNKLMLFSCDQKIEHLNRDFYGPGIASEDNDPEHMFKIAHGGDIGAFATHLGLIAQYGQNYRTINYIVKLNGKTDIIKTEYDDPISRALWTIDQVVAFKKNSGLSIRGVGYTLYLGSTHESLMLAQAAEIINQAHHHGLVTILWMYPRGKNVPVENAGELIAGAAGVACALGADFAKINPPQENNNKSTQEWLAIASQAAGKTKLIISGGSKVSESTFLHDLYNNIHNGHISGTATGRNIHQRKLHDAILLTRAISGIVYNDYTVHQVMDLMK